MFKGFYQLTSGMLSQGRRLDTVSNNMANVSTIGYKADLYTDSTFREYVASRIGNKEKSNREEIGDSSYILAPSVLYTDHTQGAVESTGMPLDFALMTDGFFAIQSNDGIAYSRNGSFSLDNEGYLCLPDEGRVLDMGGNEILLGADSFSANPFGEIYGADGTFVAQLGVFVFADNNALERNPRGLFEGAGAQPAENPELLWQYVERSNIDLVEQMVSMISSQRALQSAAQVTKMYDQLMSKAANDLGRV